MSNAAHIVERAAPAHGAEPHAVDPRIAVAEMWLCMLGALSEVARRFSRYLVHRVMPFGPAPQEPFLVFRFRGDPITAYRRVLRTLRFAAVLYLRIEKQIAAWRAGERFDLEAFLAETPLRRGRAASGAGADDEAEEFEAFEDFGNLVEWESYREFDFLGAERPAREDKYIALLKGPLKDAIAAICKELGLKPDWSLWTERGFPPPPGGDVEAWVAFFAPKGAVAPKPGPAEQGPPMGAPPCPDDPLAAAIWRRRWLPPERWRDRSRHLAGLSGLPLAPPRQALPVTR